MKKYLCILLIFIPIKFYSQSESRFGYTGGIHSGGLSGISLDAVMLYRINKEYNYGFNPFLSAEIGYAGTKYRLGAILWSTLDGPKAYVNNRMPLIYFTGFEFSFNYGYLWSIDNKPKLLLGYGEDKRYFGLESGIGLLGLNYKFGYYFSSKGNIFTHCIGIGL
jgi:hypothetical protein